MPAGMGEEERFAACVEYGTMPRSTGHVDDSADGLARDLEIAALLRSAGPALAPEPAARARAKQRLMAAFAQEFGDDADATGPLRVTAPVAVAPRPVARHAEPTPLRHAADDDRPRRRAGRHSAPEQDAPEPAVPGLSGADVPEQAARNVRSLRTRREAAPVRGGHRHAAILGAAAAAALVALATGGTFASQDALPGDSMYGVKRVAESTGLALTFSEEAKARRHLEQAQRRLDEVEGMVARDRAAVAAGEPEEASDPDLVRSTMQEFDADTSEGSRLLLAGEEPNTADVDDLRTWAEEQSARLSGMRETLPTPDRADESLALLDRLLGETEALQGGEPCDTTVTDEGVTAAASAEACPPSTDSLPSTADVTGSAEPESDDENGSNPEDSSDAGSDDEDGSTDDGRQGDEAPASTSVRGSSDTTTTAPERRRDGSDGGSSGSGGAGTLSVPLPLPNPVDVPPVVPGLPGLSLGGS